jgi:hypothetical protein
MKKSIGLFVYFVKLNILNNYLFIAFSMIDFSIYPSNKAHKKLNLKTSIADNPNSVASMKQGIVENLIIFHFKSFKAFKSRKSPVRHIIMQNEKFLNVADR